MKIDIKIPLGAFVGEKGNGINLSAEVDPRCICDAKELPLLPDFSQASWNKRELTYSRSCVPQKDSCENFVRAVRSVALGNDPRNEFISNGNGQTFDCNLLDAIKFWDDKAVEEAISRIKEDCECPLVRISILLKTLKAANL